MNKRKRKIKYRSWHRGTREADLFLGNFIDKHIDILNETLLKNFEEFIQNYSDPEIMSFVNGINVWPNDLKDELRDLFKKFIISEKKNN